MCCDVIHDLRGGDNGNVRALVDCLFVALSAQHRAAADQGHGREALLRVAAGEVRLVRVHAPDDAAAGPGGAPRHRRTRRQSHPRARPRRAQELVRGAADVIARRRSQ